MIARGTGSGTAAGCGREACGGASWGLEFGLLVLNSTVMMLIVRMGQWE